MTLHDAYWRELQREIAGVIVRPESADYEQLRKPKMVRLHDIKPDAIMLRKPADDVAETMGFAPGSRGEQSETLSGHLSILPGCI